MNRAGYKCELCRVPQRALVTYDAYGVYTILDKFMAAYERKQGNKVYVVHLRVIALDGNRNNQEMSNLRALCPRCCNRSKSR